MPSNDNYKPLRYGAKKNKTSGFQEKNERNQKNDGNKEDKKHLKIIPGKDHHYLITPFVF